MAEEREPVSDFTPYCESGTDRGRSCHRAQDKFGRWIDEDDVEALAQLFALMMEPALALARRLTDSTELAEDAVQEAFLSAMQGRKPRRVGNARGWVLAVVANRARKMRRREQPAQPLLATDADRSQPSEGADVMETRRQLQQAIKDLPQRLREPVELHFLAGLTLADTAAIIGRPLSTVHEQIKKALECMRRFLRSNGVTLHGAALMPLLQDLQDAALPAGRVEDMRRRLHRLARQEQGCGWPDSRAKSPTRQLPLGRILLGSLLIATLAGGTIWMLADATPTLRIHRVWSGSEATATNPRQLPDGAPTMGMVFGPGEEVVSPLGHTVEIDLSSGGRVLLAENSAIALTAEGDLRARIGYVQLKTMRPILVHLPQGDLHLPSATGIWLVIDASTSWAIVGSRCPVQVAGRRFELDADRAICWRADRPCQLVQAGAVLFEMRARDGVPATTGKAQATWLQGGDDDEVLDIQVGDLPPTRSGGIILPMTVPVGRCRLEFDFQYFKQHGTGVVLSANSLRELTPGTHHVPVQDRQWHRVAFRIGPRWDSRYRWVMEEEFFFDGELQRSISKRGLVPWLVSSGTGRAHWRLRNLRVVLESLDAAAMATNPP